MDDGTIVALGQHSSAHERPVPFSDDAERGLLCSLLLDPPGVSLLCADLAPDVFYIPANRIAYGAIREFIEAHRAPEFYLLKQLLFDRNQLADVGGAEYLNSIYTFVPIAANAPFYLGVLKEKYFRRKLLTITERALDPDAELSTLLNELEIVRGFVQPISVEWLKPKKISELTDVQPEQILRGMLYERCKMVLMGGSKSFKTWTLMDIAYCVANGLLWWGVHTKRCPVIYLDFELLDFDFRWRLEQIARAYGKGNIDAVRRIGIKGKTLKEKHWAQIHGCILQEGAGLVVADPTYKLLGPHRDENSASDIAQVTALFDRITEETLAAVIYAQHFSKGNQAGKESIDRGAGSGVWARDADAIVTMTKHAQGDDYLSIEHTLRSFARIDPFVVRWNCPLFERAPELDPADLKQPGNGRAATYCVNDLVDCLNGQELKTGELEKLFREEKGASRRTFYALLKEAQQKNRIHKCKIDQKWERVSKLD